MSRLKDADEFKKFLQALCKAGAPYDEVIQLLDKEPTVYEIDIVKKGLEELEQYRAIGTIEEFKTLKEKSVGKKPIIKGLMAIDDRRYYCPKCNKRLYKEHFDVGYCNCGQSIAASAISLL